ncbi:hypothetical protein TBLA_0E03700 [Henningerozyma blattae CBS 6284]|uniref:Ribonuclease n=1 Tax=Henningerozyma blattae (strain ATCC 34711 / CBS 6284 / DSM 70876 / NBRC 10599 / NRRL Y-10934 / UCD 77-7) TaxID=1071380 RepID=I2H4X2_HENB6|nr:hypothetical protein TBLA_0E03700 [Tetrapisispora blattae CBS 6284]CCH61424.1 hypothetical protein TBLA_0E03700 [Tetrapisispora blattae CBS 6284]
MDTSALPPTVLKSLNSLHTKTYYSSVPDSIVSKKDTSPIILGVDEAGRGPVLGPMVYGIAYCTTNYMNEFIIPNYEFDDSKKLTDTIRKKLFSKMYSNDPSIDPEINQIGYATTAITPNDISSGMLRFPPSKNYNLNEQAHDVTIALIQGVLDQNVQLSHVYVDTVGPPQSYQKKLETRFPNVKFTVTKKADSLYCIVSVASVVAKVTRDFLIDSMKRNPNENIGSGYPSDPNTKRWLRESQTKLFGWPCDMVRFSWQTCDTLLTDSNTKSIQIDWEEDFLTKKRKFNSKDYETNLLKKSKEPKTLENWFFN